MGQRSWWSFLLRLGVGGAALASAGCGQTERNRAAGGDADAPDEGCQVGESHCNTAGLRETCTAAGVFAVTDFVCAENVAVDDDVGSYCVTKTDGSYRCWGGDPSATPLPASRYRRVQLARGGLVGLTEDGRLLASGGITLPDGLPRVATFRATNMWSDYGICPLTVDGSFLIVLDAPSDALRSDEVRVQEGTFRQALCVFEGLAMGVRSDGSVWSNHVEPLPGNDWAAVALSIGIYCGLKSSGEVQCAPSFLSCVRVDQYSPCEAFEPPEFPAGRYRSITATGAAACALDEQGVLLCRRFDGADLPVEPGPYTFVEGGKDVVCAVRTDGAASCFRHGGEGWLGNVTDFVPLALEEQ